MADEAKIYKKFFLQKSVLDSLRVYLDLTDTFYQELASIELLPESELERIKHLQWPLNRNFLLQILVKLSWNKESFHKFCTVIKVTQNQQLQRQIVDKANEHLHKRESLTNSHSSHHDDRDGSGNPGNRMTMMSKVANKIQIRQRDDRIRLLEAENSDLKRTIAVLNADNSSINNQSANLDKFVMDMLTAIGFDIEEAPVEGLLSKVSEEYWRNVEKIHRLNNEVRNLKNVNRELRERVTTFTEEVISTKSELAAMQEKYYTTLTSSQDVIDHLTSDLHAERARIQRLVSDGEEAARRHAQERAEMEEEVYTGRCAVAEMRRAVGAAAEERDAAVGELGEVTDRTRKLLASLDLLTTCATTSLAIDHARNLAYSRRRRGPGASPAPPPSEDTVYLAAELSEKVINTARSDTQSSVSFLTATPRGATTKPETQSSVSYPLLNNTPRGDTNKTTGIIPALTSTKDMPDTTTTMVKCTTCGKQYSEAGNYEGACVFHPADAGILHAGTSLEVWSCCKSVDTIRGCLKSRHTHGSKQ